MIRKTSLLLAGLSTLGVAAAQAPLVDPGKDVAGVSQSDWTRAWWQWAASFTQDEGPVGDPTGARCGESQRGPVWFLAGTYRTDDPQDTKPTVRKCTVPAGKFLFFPLVNYVVMRPSDRVVTCGAVVESAGESLADVSALVLRVDGRAYADLAAQRIASNGCFDLGTRRTPPVRIYPAAADGYYAMLAPLPRGRHTIEFGGILPDMIQAVTYTIDVR